MATIGRESLKRWTSSIKSGSVTNSFGLELSITASISRALINGDVATATAPRRSNASHAVIKCGRFSSLNKTRSPGPIPFSCSAPAMHTTWL